MIALIDTGIVWLLPCVKDSPQAVQRPIVLLWHFTTLGAFT